jgi:hypothetical protein
VPAAAVIIKPAKILSPGENKFKGGLMSYACSWAIQMVFLRKILLLQILNLVYFSAKIN